MWSAPGGEGYAPAGAEPRGGKTPGREDTRAARDDGLNVDDIEKAIELVDIHREELAELMYLGGICGYNPEALIDLVTSGRSGELVCENGTARQPSTQV